MARTIRVQAAADRRLVRILKRQERIGPLRNARVLVAGVVRRICFPAKEKGLPDEDMPKLIAIDLQPMAPIERTTIQGDMTSMAKVEEILAHFTDRRKADLVISDGAPDVTGLHDMDEFMQAQLILSGLTVCTHILADRGTYVREDLQGKSSAPTPSSSCSSSR